MNLTPTAAPTLLTAVPQPSNPTQRDSAGDFATDLDTAVTASRAETDSDAEAPVAPPVATAEPEAPRATIEEEPAGEFDADEEAAAASALLATVLVSETLVLETAPGAVLPEGAVTTADVLGVSTAAPPAPAELVGAFLPATQNATATLPPGQPIDAKVEPTPTTTPAVATELKNPEAPQRPVGVETIIQEAAEAIAAEGSPTPTPISPAIESITYDGEPLVDESASTEAPPPVSPPSPSGEQGQAGEGDESPEGESTAGEAAEAPRPELAPIAAIDRSAASIGPEGATAPSEASPTVTPLGEGRPTAPRGEAVVPPGPEPRSVEIDPARFVSRVSRAIDFANERGGGPIEMRLSPPELGSMQVRIELREGVMTAKLDVETPAARNALLDNLPALRDRLEQQQVRIDKFEVEVRDDRQSGGDWREQQDHRDQHGRQSPEHRVPSPALRRPPATSVRSPAVSSPGPLSASPSSINLVA